MLDGIQIRSADLNAVEVAWFSALCNDDYEFLGVEDERLRSTWAHCRDITKAADALGYNNILLPNGYVPGQDTLTFAGGMAAATAGLSLGAQATGAALAGASGVVTEDIVNREPTSAGRVAGGAAAAVAACWSSSRPRSASSATSG